MNVCLREEAKNLNSTLCLPGLDKKSERTFEILGFLEVHPAITWLALMKYTGLQDQGQCLWTLCAGTTP